MRWPAGRPVQDSGTGNGLAAFGQDAGDFSKDGFIRILPFKEYFGQMKNNNTLLP